MLTPLTPIIHFPKSNQGDLLNIIIFYSKLLIITYRFYMLLALLSDFITPLKPQGPAVCSTDTWNSHTSKYLYTLCSEHFFPTSLHSFLPYFIHLFAELPSCQSSLLWLHERAWQFLTLSVFYCFIFFIKYITRYNIMYLFANIVLSVSWEYWL